jgi:hypothetical protein
MGVLRPSSDSTSLAAWTRAASLQRGRAHAPRSTHARDAVVHGAPTASAEATCPARCSRMPQSSRPNGRRPPGPSCHRSTNATVVTPVAPRTRSCRTRPCRHFERRELRSQGQGSAPGAVSADDDSMAAVALAGGSRCGAPARGSRAGCVLAGTRAPPPHAGPPWWRPATCAACCYLWRLDLQAALTLGSRP